MEHLGTYFMGPVDGAGEMTCEKVMDFAAVFNTYAKHLYNLDRWMSQSDFIQGFKDMNINGYIQALPEYRKAVQEKSSNEGMKFFDNVLLKKISGNN